jgi:choice-of-anchor A domain-containing protein
MRKITFLACFLFATQLIYSQEAIPVSGGVATGSEGSGTYSVGQTFYTTNTAAIGSGSQGVQQPFEFSVNDLTPPIVITQDITTQLDANGNATITAAQINNGSTDNSGGVLTYSLDKDTFDCNDFSVSCSDSSILFNGSGIASGANGDNIQNLGLNQLTMEAWVKPDNSSINSIIRKAGDYDLYINNNILYAEVWYEGRASSAQYLYSGPTVSANAWSHLAFTFDKANSGSAKFYVNGVETVVAGTTRSIAPDITLGIGGSTQYGQSFTGLIDDVRIWSTERTNTEINDFKDFCIDANSTGLEAYYKIEANIGSILTDYSGNGNHLTITGASWSTEGAPIESAGVEVTLTVTDVAGNAAVGVANVIVLDEIAPSITLNGDTTVYHDAFTTYTDLGATTADNCSVTLVSTDDIDVNVTGSYTMTYTATDGSANETIETRTVVVRDVTLPTAIAQNLTVPLDANGNATITAAQINNGSTDNSGGALTYSLDKDTFDCDDAAGSDNLYGLKFNGNNAISTDLDVDDAVVPNTTWEAWINPSLQNTNWQMIFGIENGGWDRFLAINNGNLYTGYGTNGHLWTSISYNTWTHVALVFEGTSMRLYKDGQEFLFPGVVNTNIQNSTRKFHIGSSIQGSGVNPLTQFFNGKIDEVRVWDKARTQTEIQADINSTLTGNENNLIGYWPFEEGPNNLVTQDVSVNNNNGTLNYFNAVNDWVSGASGLTSNSESVILTVTDESGNSSTATAVVTIEDTEFPAVVLNGNAIIQHDAFTPYVDQDVVVTDNCSATLVTTDNVNVNAAGSYTVTYTATDSSNNVTVETRTVVVRDVILPTAIAQDITVQLDANGSATITAAQINDSSTDDSGGALTYSLDKDTFDCDDLGGAISNGSSLNFDGSNDLVDCGDIPFNTLDNFTIEVMVKPRTLAPNSNPYGNNSSLDYIIHKAGNAYDAFALSCNQAEFRFFFNPGGVILKSNVAPQLNKWTQVSVTYDKNQLKLYVDGVLQDSVNLSSSMAATTNPIQIGGRNGGVSEYFDGQIDDVRIWSETKTASEITNNFNNDLLGNESELIAYYNMEGITGNVLNDLTGTYNGTISGASISTDVPPISYASSSIEVTLTVTDESNNSSTAIANVTIEDTILPTLSLNDPVTINLDQGESYIEKATVADNCSATLEIIGTVDNLTPGVYTLLYKATDSSGNVSAQLTRTVNIIDLVDPLDDGVTTLMNTPVLIDVVDNDVVLPVTGTMTVSSPTDGTVFVSDPKGTPNNPSDDMVTYIPNSGFVGTNSFTYTVCNANGICDFATVTVTVESSTVFNPIASAACFNVFVEEAVTITQGSTAGSMAVGGDLTINGNYNIASNDCGCFNVGGNDLGLVVGGKVLYPNTNTVLNIVNSTLYAKIGESNGSTVWYQDPQNGSTPIKVVPLSDYSASSHILLGNSAVGLNVSANNNPVFQTEVLDFDAAFQDLKTSSLSLSQNITNVDLSDFSNQSISNTNLPSNVRITPLTGVNYFNITGVELNNVTQLDVSPTHFYGSKILVVNIDASGTFNWDVWQQSGIAPQDSENIIYNFYNATELIINSNEIIYGTILAPLAAITKTNTVGAISGQVIGKSFTHDGGEIQCAGFAPSVSAPQAAAIAPVAVFTVNDIECLTDNVFAFDNTSSTSNLQPGNPISYDWNFGDGTSSTFMSPSKTYINAGVYTVTLTASNSFGSDTSTFQVTVLPEISADVTVSTRSIANGSIGKDFVLNNPQDFTSYSWSLPGEGTNLFVDQNQVYFSFTQPGLHMLTVTGVNLNGCIVDTIIPVNILSSEVSSGNGGGVESESLGDAISKIYVGRKKNSVPTNFVKSSENLYNKTKLISTQPYQGKGQTLLDMFPTELVSGNIANVTSPTDILDYTVADEVLSVDFSLDGKTKGVVLGIKTTDKIYNHTKASCDRLRGAEILNIETVTLNGYNFLMQGIKQRNGLVEYAISFVTAKNNNDSNYTIQTNWYVNNYIKFNDVYNFQVWSTNPTDTKKLVVDVLENLKSFIPVSQTEVQKVPETYAAKISREKGELVILMRSIEKGLSTEVSMQELYSETANNVKHRYNSIYTSLEQTLRVDIKDGYEYDALVKVNGEVEDAFYHADGNWGLDYDKNYTEVLNYFVWNDFDRIYNDDEYSINRNIEIQAKSEYDYLTVYKSLLPGTLSADYSEYNYVAFTAKGSGLMELGLIKSSIEDWKAQYRVMVDFSEEEQTYYVPFEIFTSIATQEVITADDLTTLTFTFLPVEAQTKQLDLTISNVRFTKSAVEGQVVNHIEKFNNEFMAYPNPSKGNVNLLLFSETDTEATVTLADVTGKIIYRQKTQLIVGRNELELGFKVKPGVMLLKVDSGKVNYGVSKIIFR